jgi:hypothetical protein
VVCPTCNGVGYASGGFSQECSSCHGTGRVPPETPDELLADEWIFLTYKKYKRQPNLLAMPAYERNIIKHFLSKCHQSEAAIRADERKKIGEWLRKWMMHTKNLNWADKADLKTFIAKLQKCHQSEATEIDKLNMTLRTGEQQFIQQEARIKELESELEIIDKNYRIKKGETWYWEKDSNNYLESLTCPVIINANDLRDLISEARADQNRKIGDYILNIIGKKPHLTPSWLVDLAAKLQKGDSPE